MLMMTAKEISIYRWERDVNKKSGIVEYRISVLKMVKFILYFVVQERASRWINMSFQLLH
jgi:hypothetical protein